MSVFKEVAAKYWRDAKVAFGFVAGIVLVFAVFTDVTAFQAVVDGLLSLLLVFVIDLWITAKRNHTQSAD